MPETEAAPVDINVVREPLPLSFFMRTELQAVLRIIEADDYLARAVRPYIDEKNVAIDWDKIFLIKFGKAHNTALKIAYGIWTDRLPQAFDPFHAALSLTSRLQLAVLEALAIKWRIVPEPRKVTPGKVPPSRIVFK